MPYTPPTNIAPLVINATTGAISGWTTGAGLTFHGGGTLTGASGALTLAPISGTNVLIPFLASGSKLQFGATAGATLSVSADTTAGVFTLSVPSAGSAEISMPGGTTPTLYFRDSTAQRGFIATNAGKFQLGTVGNFADEFYTNNLLSLSLTGGAAATLTGGAGNMTITSGTGNSRTLALQTTTSGGVATDAIVIGATQLITKYGNVATAGWGVPAIQANGTIAATTNARSAAVATYTVGAADGTFVVSGNILITTSTTFSFSLDCVYTDEGNTSRTLVIPLAQLAGTFVATGLATNVTGAGPYESPGMTIRCKASTSITIRPSAGGTYTAVVYNVNASIQQIA